MFHRLAIFAAIAALVSVQAAHAADPAVGCESGKLKASGKYASCLLGADAKALLKGTSPDYTKCGEKIDKSWLKAETKGAGQCPNGEGDQSEVQSFLDACSQSASAALEGTTPLPADPITCDSDLATCDGDLTTCNAGLDACLPLAGCAFRGIVGDWVAMLPDAQPNPDVCTLSFSLTSANVATASLTACGYLPGATMTGTLTGNVVTAAQDVAPICFGLYRLETTATLTSCDTATGSYVCRDGVGGPIVANGTFTATRL